MAGLINAEEQRILDAVAWLHGIGIAHEIDKHHGQIPYYHDVESTRPHKMSMLDRFRKSIRLTRNSL